MPGRKTPTKYAGHEERIQALCASDCAFSEVWVDYCEIVNLSEASTTPNEELLALRGELEMDIDEALG